MGGGGDYSTEVINGGMAIIGGNTRAANNGSQRTMSSLIADLTGQTPVLPVILTGHFWIQTLYFPYSCRLMLYNAAMISFFFGIFAALH